MASLEGWSFAIKLYPRLTDSFYIFYHIWQVFFCIFLHFFTFYPQLPIFLPILSHKNSFFYIFRLDSHYSLVYTLPRHRGRRSMVGRVLPKHETRVRFPSPVSYIAKQTASLFLSPPSKRALINKKTKSFRDKSLTNATKLLNFSLYFQKNGHQICLLDHKHSASRTDKWN